MHSAAAFVWCHGTLIRYQHTHTVGCTYACQVQIIYICVGLQYCPVSVSVYAEHAMAGLSNSSSGWPDPDICCGVAPRDNLATHHPSRHLYHSGCCGLSCVHCLCFAGALPDASDAQQAPGQRCHQKDEPARLGKANCWAVLTGSQLNHVLLT